MPLMKIVGDDMWDPNNWVPDEHEHRIYSPNLEVYAVVDFEDYIDLCQYKWSVHDPKKIDHPYLRRGLHEGLGLTSGKYESPITGKLVYDKKRVQGNRFLHQDVMLRKGVPKPTPKHKEVDHADRDVGNCRRANLNWATRAEQIRNSKQWINGKRRHYERQQLSSDVQPGGQDRL